MTTTPEPVFAAKVSGVRYVIEPGTFSTRATPLAVTASVSAGIAGAAGAVGVGAAVEVGAGAVLARKVSGIN